MSGSVTKNHLSNQFAFLFNTDHCSQIVLKACSSVSRPTSVVDSTLHTSKLRNFQFLCKHGRHQSLCGSDEFMARKQRQLDFGRVRVTLIADIFRRIFFACQAVHTNQASSNHSICIAVLCTIIKTIHAFLFQKRQNGWAGRSMQVRGRPS